MTGILLEGELTGFMGLTFQDITKTTTLLFWQYLINDNLLTSPQLSFFITQFINDTNAQEGEPGGVLTLGGTDPSLYQGDIDFFGFTPPITGSSYWLQTVTGAPYTFTLKTRPEHR